MRAGGALILVLVLAGPAPALAAQATFEGHVLTSTGFPAGSITFPGGFEHLGPAEVILASVAHSEVHVLVEVDDARAKRMYWVQFEGYLPDAPYKYENAEAQRKTTIGGHSYIEDLRYFDVEISKTRIKPGSDFERILQLIEARGLTFGPYVMSARWVRADADARSRVSITYLEDLRDHGLAPADLAPGGRAAGDWPRISSGLRERGLAGLTIQDAPAAGDGR